MDVSPAAKSFSIYFSLAEHTAARRWARPPTAHALALLQAAKLIAIALTTTVDKHLTTSRGGVEEIGNTKRLTRAADWREDAETCTGKDRVYMHL